MTHGDIMQKHSVKDGVRHELTAEVKEPRIPVLARTGSLWRKGSYFILQSCPANQRQWYPPTHLSLGQGNRKSISVLTVLSKLHMKSWPCSSQWDFLMLTSIVPGFLSTICYQKCWLLFKRILKPLLLVTAQIRIAQSTGQETNGGVEIPLPSSWLAYCCCEQRVRIWPELTALLSVWTEKHRVHCYTAEMDLNASTNRRFSDVKSWHLYVVIPPKTAILQYLPQRTQ